MMDIKRNSSIMGSRKRYISTLSILVLLGLVLSACGASGGGLAIGDPAPSFTLPSASGEQVSLADYQGKQPVLLYFHMALG
jgi:cytochrome oxidase Cu insertion factor (SCO1/SenC/PrrC family)